MIHSLLFTACVVFAFRGTTEEKSHTFNLKGFDAKKRYELTYEDDTGKAITLSGKQLIEDGVMVTLPELNRSELIFFTAR